MVKAEVASTTTVLPCTRVAVSQKMRPPQTTLAQRSTRPAAILGVDKASIRRALTSSSSKVSESKTCLVTQTEEFASSLR